MRLAKHRGADEQLRNGRLLPAASACAVDTLLTEQSRSPLGTPPYSVELASTSAVSF